MSYTVRFFGKIADITGQQQKQMPFTPRLKEVMDQLRSDFPALKDQRYLVAVNKEVIDGDRDLHPGDEIALLPPYSGG